MKKMTILLSAVLAVSMSISVSAADVEKIIKARKGFMQVYAFNLGLVGDMAKGKAAYDAKIAQNAADNLLALANMNNGPMWPKGSSKSDPGLEDKTRALPEIWTTYPEVKNKSKDLKQALANFTKVAGKDLASLKQGLKEVGKGCKGCHKKFRAEKKKK